MVTNTSSSTISDDSHAKLYSPEDLYSGWISNSLVLMTSSLLFYHMTKSTIEMDARIAGIFAVILILVSIAYEIYSVIPYYQRTDAFIQDKKNKRLYPDQVKREKANQILYVVLGSILAIIQLGIAVVIIKGSFKDIIGKHKF